MRLLALLEHNIYNIPNFYYFLLENLQKLEKKFLYLPNEFLQLWKPT